MQEARRSLVSSHRGCGSHVQHHSWFKMPRCLYVEIGARLEERAIAAANAEDGSSADDASRMGGTGSLNLTEEGITLIHSKQDV